MNISSLSDPNKPLGYNEATKAFKKDPTLENYYRLRSEYPNEVVEIAVSNGLFWLQENEELLKSLEIHEEFLKALNIGDPSAISELSLELIAKLVERRKLEASSETHLVSRDKVLSDSLINFLILMMFDAMEWNDEIDFQVPRDLVILLREQLGGTFNSREKEFRTSQLKKKALSVATNMLKKGKTPSLRSVGMILGVNASTILRLFPRSNLSDEAKARLSKRKANKKSTSASRSKPTKKAK